jgi:hypothetical protein
MRAIADLETFLSFVRWETRVQFFYIIINGEQKNIFVFGYIRYWRVL